MSGTFANTLLSSRRLRRIIKPALPETAALTLDHGFKLFVDPRDMTGPSYYVMNDGAEAFYHYEKLEKGEVISGMQSDHPVFIDVGANIGLFGLFVARLLPHASVHAFEPHPLLASCLKQTAGANSLQRFTVNPMALSDAKGSLTLWIHGQNSGGHSLDQKDLGTESAAGSVKVELTTLDDYVAEKKLPQVDVIKIDVQGHEMKVLHGARETLKKFQPKLLVEVDLPALSGNYSTISQLFTENGIHYRVWREVGQENWKPLSQLTSALSEMGARGVGQVNLVLQK